jgi:hypothetical protein
MSVADVILSKFIFPTHLDSVEIREQVAEAIRQRAFYSARMACKSYLEQLQRVCAAYAKGDINAADARARAQSVLDSLGLSDPSSYKMVDPGSTQRLNLILKTQRAMAASVARLDRQTPAILDQWPAWRLERYGSRSAPRQDWPARWKAAGDAVGWQGASKREMVALKTSPIWKALGQGVGGFHDALGNPYPPFAYSSGLGWSDVTREEAERLGILEDAPLGPPPRASLTPTEQEIADAMAGLRTFNKQCPDCGRFIGKPQHDCKVSSTQEEATSAESQKTKDNHAKGKVAWAEAIKGKDVKGAMHRDSLGEIDFLYGNEKWGICHALGKHRPDADKIPGIIAYGSIWESNHFEGRYFAIKKRLIVVLQKTKNNNAYIITGYLKNDVRKLVDIKKSSTKIEEER